MAERSSAPYGTLLLDLTFFPASKLLNKKKGIRKQQKHTQNDSLESKVLQIEDSEHTDKKMKRARSNKSMQTIFISYYEV